MFGVGLDLVCISMEYGPIDGNLWGTARPFFLGCVALADLEAGANRSETCASLTHLVSFRHTSISDVASLDQTRSDQTKPNPSFGPSPGHLKPGYR